MTDSEAAPLASAEVPAPTSAPATSPQEDTATLRNAMAANDRARVAAEKRAADIQAERDQYAARLAEIEGQSKSELEKAIEKAAAAEKRAAKAEADAARVVLVAKYPTAAGTFGDDDPLPSEATLAALEAKLSTATPAVPPTPEPPATPPPNPAKQEPVSKKLTVSELFAQVAERGRQENPEWYE